MVAENVEKWINLITLGKTNDFTYTPMQSLSSEDEAELNSAGWVIKSRRMITVGEAPMETQWIYELAKVTQ